MEGTLRAFVAINLPEEIIEHVRSLQDALKDHGLKLRWVKPSNLHLTLKFLGEIPEKDIAAIGKAVQLGTGIEAPLDLTIQGMGVFPGIKRPRVLWIGIGGEAERLKQIQDRIEGQFESMGYRREKRSFKAHLTLARIKGKVSPRRLLGAIEAEGDFGPQPFTATKLILYKSDLRPSGAVYTALKEVVLQ